MPANTYLHEQTAAIKALGGVEFWPPPKRTAAGGYSATVLVCSPMMRTASSFTSGGKEPEGGVPNRILS